MIANAVFYEYQKSIETITQFGATKKRLQRALQVAIDILNREMDEQDCEDFDNEAGVLFDKAAEFADVTNNKIAKLANIDLSDLKYFREFGIAHEESDDPFVLAEPLGSNVGGQNLGTVQEDVLKIFTALQSIIDDFSGNETDESDAESTNDILEVADENKPLKTTSLWVANPLRNFENRLAYNDFVAGLEQLIADLEDSKSFANSENVAEARRQHLVGLVGTVLKLLDAPMIDAEFVETGKNEFEKYGDDLEEETNSVETDKNEFEKFGDELKEETKSAVKKGIVKSGLYWMGELGKLLINAG